MQRALGVTGVEGIFRKSCQAVLACLRSHAEPILLLLEAVLNDNLVEWAPDRPDTAATKVSSTYPSTCLLLEAQRCCSSQAFRPLNAQNDVSPKGRTQTEAEAAHAI